MDFDKRLHEIEEKMGDDDILIITADHGCDPTFSKHTDHTREYVPLLIYGNKIKSENLDTMTGFSTIGKFVLSYLLDGYELEKYPGDSIYDKIIK
jgi:phosphopentomutase